MPKILEDRRKAIARNNPKLSESSTWAIATSALQKEGKLPKKKYQEGGKVDPDQQGRDYEDHPQPTKAERERNAQIGREAPERAEQVKRATDPTTVMPGFTPKRSRMPEPEYKRGGKVTGVKYFK